MPGAEPDSRRRSAPTVRRNRGGIPSGAFFSPTHRSLRATVASARGVLGVDIGAKPGR